MARRNQSVERFKRLTKDLQKEVHAQAVAELHNQGAALVAAIERVTPRGETGNLEHSVRMIPGKRDTQIRIVAGGALTVRAGVSSKPYDYARADEFGYHVNGRLLGKRPFFFPTYRLMKKRMISAMKRKITAAIKKRSA